MHNLKEANPSFSLPLEPCKQLGHSVQLSLHSKSHGRKLMSMPTTEIVTKINCTETSIEVGKV